MTFQEQLRLLRKKQGVEDVLVSISAAVLLYNAFYHDKGSLIFASLCAGYLPVGIGIVAVKTRRWPSRPGWMSVALCGSALVSIASAASLT